MTVSALRRVLAARRMAAYERLIRALDTLEKANDEMRAVAVELEELGQERVPEDES